MALRTLKTGARAFPGYLLNKVRRRKAPKAITKRAAVMMARGKYAKRVRSKPVRSKRYAKALMGRTVAQEGNVQVTRRLMSGYLSTHKRKGKSTGHSIRAARKKVGVLRSRTGSSRTTYRRMTNTVGRALRNRAHLRPKVVRSRAVGMRIRRR